MLIGYARVSTAGDRQSLDLQIDALVAAGVDRRNIHQDRKSGAADDRPGLVKAMAILEPGDSLVVWSLDRLGRNLAHLVKLLADLDGRSVDLKILQQDIDTSTPAGRLWFNMAATFAEYERALASERINAGLVAAARRGRKGGRPPVISDEQMEYILRDVAAGVSKREICRKYGLKWTTLYKTLRRLQVAGVVDAPAPVSETIDIEEVL